MKIVYGIAGEGLGHLARSKTIIEHLKRSGHKILVITYGQTYPSLSQKCQTIKINGIHPAFRNNKIKVFKSILCNFPRVARDILRWKEVNKKIKNYSPDLFITDFEPFTARLSYFHKKPLISIDNQHILLHQLPREITKPNYMDFLVSKWASYFCVPKADTFLIFSLYKLSSLKQNSIITSPLIKDEIKKTRSRSKKGSHILVYLSKPDDSIIKIFKQVPEQFIVYGYNQNFKDKNIIFKKNNLNFPANLASAKAVIGTAGFSLICESAYLKKPYFALPYYHFEQKLNAFTVKQLGIGEYAVNPTKEQIINFLNHLPTYEKNLKKINFNEEEPLRIINLTINRVVKNLTSSFK